ncbi:MAG: Gfo/Idh/MocA family oxidoreductase [Herpetosiphon sp.]
MNVTASREARENSHLPEAEPTLRVAVLGLGGMGTRHAINIHRHVPAAKLTAVYDLDPERARQGAARCGFPDVVNDPIQLIQSPYVDAVIIASPDHTHTDFVLECLRCNKPVLCEKPLATTAAEAATIVTAECALGRQLVAVGFMRRFDPQHLAVKQVIAAGSLGRAIVFKGVHRNASSADPVLPGTVIISSASHDIDSARWLLGADVEEVYMRGVRSHATSSNDTIDMLLFHMVLAGDCLATVEVFVNATYGYEVSAEIVAERGTVVTMQPDYVTVRANGSRSVPVPIDWLARFQNAYVAELHAWVASIQTSQPFNGANAWDGYMSLLTTDACFESLKSGAPVSIQAPSKPPLYAP